MTFFSCACSDSYTASNIYVSSSHNIAYWDIFPLHCFYILHPEILI